MSKKENTRAFGFLEGKTKEPTPDFDNSYALIIGINDYQNGIFPLKTPVNDATRLARILKHNYKYKGWLRTKQNTLSSLRKTLHNLQKVIGENDRLLFYFAGHGVALDGDDGPAGYLVPQDAHSEDHNSFLPMAELHDSLTALPCRHLLAIFDCCFAGAFRWASMRNLPRMPEVIHQERYFHYIRDPAWQVLTSSAYDQQALDVAAGMTLGLRDEELSHSPFALMLCDLLEQKATDFTAIGGNGLITATELYLYLRTHVETYSDRHHRRQTPGLWPLTKHDKGEYLFELPGYKIEELPLAPELNPENNPYRGLLSYEADHSGLFFGREEQIQELAARVETNQLSVLLGASGTGKSSLVKAGVMPYLQANADNIESKGLKWQFLPPLRPGEHPAMVLRALLYQQLKPESVQDSLETWLETWHTQDSEVCLLVFIDQLEELVTLCRHDQERNEFVKMLQLLWQHPNVHLLLTLRNDFETQLSTYFPQADWQAARVFITPMTQDELREVIEGPASVRVLYFEPPELVDMLINEVVQTPGALPLLSFTLSELYLRYAKKPDGNRA
ncbi:MAG: caspase family protein, partial [Pseudomonadota bacterium]